MSTKVTRGVDNRMGESVGERESEGSAGVQPMGWALEVWWRFGAPLARYGLVLGGCG